MFGLWGKQKSLSSFDTPLTRERIIRAARIVIIDDELPLILEELRSTGFSVDHDLDGNDHRNIDAQRYDVAIIDYQGVGSRLSPNQGLALMKHIKRVSPHTRRIAFTSRSLRSSEADFFTESHVVLPKDLGLAESLAIIEEQCRISLSKNNLLNAILEQLNIADSEKRQEIEAAFIKALSKNNGNKFKDHVTNLVGQAAQKTVEKLIDLAFTW